jgi:hypothetical protein
MNVMLLATMLAIIVAGTLAGAAGPRWHGMDRDLEAAIASLDHVDIWNHAGPHPETAMTGDGGAMIAGRRVLPGTVFLPGPSCAS